MTTKTQVKKLADKMKVEFYHESDYNFHDTTLYAPKGYIFDANGCECLVVNEFKMGDKSKHWATVLDDLKAGLTKI